MSQTTIAPPSPAECVAHDFAESPNPSPLGGGAAADEYGLENLAFSAGVAHALAGLGEGLGLSRRVATLRACKAVSAGGGCDLPAILQRLAPAAMSRPAADQLKLSPPEFARVAAYLADRDQCSSSDLAIGAQLPFPESFATKLRAASALRGLGWTMRRHRRFAQHRIFFRPTAEAQND